MSAVGPSGQGRILNSGSEGADLINRVGQGDVDAFAALYDLYSTPLHSLAFYILKDGGDAGNVLRAVFLSLRRDGAAFDRSPMGAYAWLALKTRRQCMESLGKISGQLSGSDAEGTA